MYTDNRLCDPCFENGLYYDGENYCTQCKNYLCLTCAKVHGRKNGLQAKKAFGANEKFAWNNDSCQHIREHIDHTGHFFNQAEQKTERGPKSVYIHGDGNVKISSKIQNDPDRVKVGVKENAIEIWKETVPKENDHILNQSSRERRQNYSARGGIVRVTNASTDGRRFELQRCSYHPEMPIENVCNIHNDLCCENCLIKDHKHCIVQPIDEVANGIFATGAIEKAEKDYKDLQAENRDVTKHFAKYIESMHSSSENMNKLKNEKQPTETVNDIEAYLKIMQTQCTELDENIGLGVSEILNAKESGSEILAFITLTKNQRALTNIKHKLHEINETSNLIAAKQNRILNQTNVNNKITETTNMDNGRNLYDNGNDIDSDKKGRFSAADENGKNKELQSKTVIAEVIFQSFEGDNGECTPRIKEERNDNEYESFQSEITEPADEGELYDVFKQERNEKSDDECKDKQRHSKPKSKSIKKYVGFVDRPVASGFFRKTFQDRVKANGLVSEYYLNNDDDDSLDGIRVLRLQSAPPERPAKPQNETSIRPKSINVMEHREMIQWQNRKMLESVEHKTESYEQGSKTPSKHFGKPLTATRFDRKKSVGSNEDKMKKKILTKHRVETDKRKLLMRSRQENASFPHNQATLSRKKSKESSLKSMFKKVETKTQAERLKQWIKQTEEINKKYKTDNSRNYLIPSEMKTTDIDEIDKVYAANVNAIDDDFTDKQAEVPVIHLLTKEATVIKTINPDDRLSSAKSRTSDSEESMYNNQTYALRPKSQLGLTHEQIVRLPEDERVCEINSISCLPDGRIVVSDFSNMEIKMFRVGLGKASVLTLDEPPHGVCVVSNSVLAVISGLARDRLLVVSAGRFLAIKRRFKTGCICRDISSYESHIYLLCLYRYKTEVRILTTDGVVSIRLDLGHTIPSPKSIAVKSVDGLIYIADQNRGVLTVELGKIVSRSFDKNIENYLGVEVDINNNVFICTENPSGIYELSYDGKHLMPILPGHGLENVTSIAYDVSSNSLVVGCANSETIKIYKINETLRLKKYTRF